MMKKCRKPRSTKAKGKTLGDAQIAKKASATKGTTVGKKRTYKKAVNQLQRVESESFGE